MVSFPELTSGRYTNNIAKSKKMSSKKVENKICQSCKKDFVIEQEDFNFYEKIKVPPPTWCPECRFQRRLAFMNVYSLYERNCDKCGIEIKTSYAPDRPEIIYCEKCYQQEVY